MTYVEAVIENHLDNLLPKQVDEFRDKFGHVIQREQLNAALIWCEQKVEENRKCGIY